jgi:hypothetical protein
MVGLCNPALWPEDLLQLLVELLLLLLVAGQVIQEKGTSTRQ